MNLEGRKMKSVKEGVKQQGGKEGRITNSNFTFTGFRLKGVKFPQKAELGEK